MYGGLTSASLKRGEGTLGDVGGGASDGRDPTVIDLKGGGRVREEEFRESRPPCAHRAKPATRIRLNLFFSSRIIRIHVIDMQRSGSRFPASHRVSENPDLQNKQGGRGLYQ